MSYIRCLSNPEALYIWSDGKHVNLSHHVKPPHSSGSDFLIPQALFRKAILSWDGWKDVVKAGELRVEEVRVDEKTGKIIPPDAPCKRCKKFKGGSFSHCGRCAKRAMKHMGRSWFPIRISYQKHFIHLWKVTWDYIVNNNREKLEKQVKNGEA